MPNLAKYTSIKLKNTGSALGPSGAFPDVQILVSDTESHKGIGKVSYATSTASTGFSINSHAYNKVEVVFDNISGHSLSFIARSSKMADDYDLDTGILLASLSNIAVNATATATFDINSTTFPITASQATAGTNSYRVGLYTQDQSSGLWDVVYLFMVKTEDGASTWTVYSPSDAADGMEVLTLDGKNTQ